MSNILFSNIIIDTQFHTGHWWGKGEPFTCPPSFIRAAEPTGRITGVRFSNIQAKAETGIVVSGSPEPRFAISGSIASCCHRRPTQSRLRRQFRSSSTPGGTIRSSRTTTCCRQVIGLRVHGFTLDWGEGLSDYFSDGIACELPGCGDRRVRETGPGGKRSRDPASERAGITIRNCTAAPGLEVSLKVSKVADQGIFADYGQG